jgi:hypothetical protein
VYSLPLCGFSVDLVFFCFLKVVILEVRVSLDYMRGLYYFLVDEWRVSKRAM